MDDKGNPRLTRRHIVTGVGLVATTTLVGVAPAFAQSETKQKADTRQGWQGEVDVICVGSGSAGLAAAVTAHSNGDSVVVLEARSIVGGTTAKSSGVYWIPNNRILRAQKIEDSKADALAYMARLSFPDYYVPGHTTLGLTQHQYDLLAAFYDNGSELVDRLVDLDICKVTQCPSSQYNPKATWTPDYFTATSENKVKTGRALQTLRDDGGLGTGSYLVGKLSDYLKRNKVDILVNHRVVDLITNSKREVIGVVVDKGGETIRVRARKAVIFGSGGFAKNQTLLRDFHRIRAYGSCAVNAAQGDFIVMASRAGAALGNMAGAWHNQVVMEQVLRPEYQNELIWTPPGDSMIYVNRYGKRVVNEVRPYNTRSRIHDVYDPVREEYTNQLLFMVFDQRAVDLFGGSSYPIPTPGENAPWIITGQTFDDLAQGISTHLKAIRESVGNISLAPDFVDRLRETVGTFNAFAAAGVDKDFGRGARDDDIQNFYVATKARDGAPAIESASPLNPTMHPIAGSGPYYAVIIGNGMLDTNGGPVINAMAQVVDFDNRPIAGLYGAGNCIASPSREGYFGPGGTIGPAMTFAYIAANSARRESAKDDV